MHQTLYSYFFSQFFPEPFTLNHKPKKGEQDENKQILEDHGMHNKLVYYGDDKARK